MKKRFLDTWFWATLIVGTEELHEEAKTFFNKQVYLGDKFYISGSVISETISLILHTKRLIKAPQQKLQPQYAYNFFTNFKEMLNGSSGQLEILIASKEQIEKSLQLLADHFRAIPGLSYVDCESVVLCRGHQIPGIMTKDPDCESLGIPIDPDWRLAMDK